MRVFRSDLWVAAALAVVAACMPLRASKPRPAAASARPFDAMPTVELVEPAQPGPTYRVRIAAEITRDVIPTDDLAIVIHVRDLEIGRYPVVGAFQNGPTRIHKEIELPLGDYEIELAYQGERYAGMPFRLAEVPVWGGRKAPQVRPHPGTRLSLAERKLWIGRWWPNDGPPQAWIVEWVHDGRIATTTSGREGRGIPPHVTSVVRGAAGAFRATQVVANTIWTFGEEYPLPAMIAQTPGAWAARIVRGKASPISVVFNVLPGGRLAEASPQRIAAAGWEPAWSERLEQRALTDTEVERLAAKLPQVSHTEPFDEPTASHRAEPAIRISTGAVRALFRSRQLAEAWWKFEQLNQTLSASAPMSGADGAASPAVSFPRSEKRTAGLGEKRRAKDVAKDRAKLRALRTQVEQLIKQHGGGWKRDEFPRS